LEKKNERAFPVYHRWGKQEPAERKIPLVKGRERRKIHHPTQLTGTVTGKRERRRTTTERGFPGPPGEKKKKGKGDAFLL